MQCPDCNSEVSTNELYCSVCGAEIRLDFDDVHERLSEEIAKEKEESTEKTLRNMLLWMAFFMITAWTFDCESRQGLIGPKHPDNAYRIPMYTSRAELIEHRLFEDTTVDTLTEIDQIIERNLRRYGK